VTNLELNWEYVIALLEEIGELFWPTPQPSHKMGNYALFVVPHLDQKVHGFWAFANTCIIHNA
jgi:hypothetical protein